MEASATDYRLGTGIGYPVLLARTLCSTTSSVMNRLVPSSSFSDAAR